MRAWQRRKGASPVGYPEGLRVKLSVAFEAEQFDRIGTYAAEHGISFAEAVRRLCRKGLE